MENQEESTQLLFPTSEVVQHLPLFLERVLYRFRCQYPYRKISSIVLTLRSSIKLVARMWCNPPWMQSKHHHQTQLEEGHPMGEDSEHPERGKVDCRTSTTTRAPP